MKAITWYRTDQVLWTSGSVQFLCCIFPADKGYRCSEQRPQTIIIITVPQRAECDITSHHVNDLRSSPLSTPLRRIITLFRLAISLTSLARVPSHWNLLTSHDYTETKPHICPITACRTAAALAHTATHTTLLHVKSGVRWKKLGPWRSGVKSKAKANCSSAVFLQLKLNCHLKSNDWLPSSEFKKIQSDKTITHPHSKKETAYHCWWFE